MFYIYFIKSELDGSVYVGISSDVKKRLKEHNSGKTRSTKSKVPYKLIYFESHPDKTSARKREIQIKRSYQAKKQILDNLTTVAL